MPWTLDLPSAFKETSAFDYLQYLDLLGMAASTPADQDPRVESTSRNYYRGGRGAQPELNATILSLKAGSDLIERWPESFITMLKVVSRRGLPKTTALTSTQAFGTTIGRSLRHPLRGYDGLPLALVCEAFDAYCEEQFGGFRKRNFTVEDATARRLHSRFNGAVLAKIIKHQEAFEYHGRVIRRVFASLSLYERAMSDDALVKLLVRRAVGLHAAVSQGLTPNAAKRMLEGTRDHLCLEGWNHPELLQADALLLAYNVSRRVYSKEAVSRTLAKLKRLARRIDDAGTLVPLVSHAMRVHLRKKPAPAKQEILLRIFRRKLRVATLVDDPTLGDLLVSIDDVHQGREVDVGPLIRN